MFQIFLMSLFNFLSFKLVFEFSSSDISLLDLAVTHPDVVGAEDVVI